MAVSFATVIFGGLIVESLVNLIKSLKQKERSLWYWGSVAAGIFFGVVITYNYNIDIFAEFGFPEGRIPFVGAILTGLLLSRGSNVISDLIALINRGASITE